MQTQTQSLQMRKQPNNIYMNLYLKRIKQIYAGITITTDHLHTHSVYTTNPRHHHTVTWSRLHQTNMPPHALSHALITLKSAAVHSEQLENISVLERWAADSFSARGAERHLDERDSRNTACVQCVRELMIISKHIISVMMEITMLNADNKIQLIIKTL